MNNPTPPPLPAADSGFRTYLRTGVFLIPSVLAWLFSVAFLLPKTRQLWQEGGLMTTRVQWVMEIAESLFSYAFLYGVAILFLVFCECFWPAWPRYRRVVFACIAVLVHLAVLIGIMAMCIAAQLAAPVLPHKTPVISK